MRLLWITNIKLPPVCDCLNLPSPVVGGWLYSSLVTLLSLSNNDKFAVATVYNGRDLKKYSVGGVDYYLLPLRGHMDKYSKTLEKFWINVRNDFNPDIVHLHGTEYAHGLAFLRACPDVKSVVSIQGLVSVCSRYYRAGISSSVSSRFLTFHDFLRGGIKRGEKKFIASGLFEHEIIQRCQHVIGRTSWDRAHVFAINPEIHYHFCNETLRESFYNSIWCYEKCEKHTIFISQASYPLKGFHQVLKAMSLVVSAYPECKIFVAGDNIIDTSTFARKMKFTGYGYYLKTIIERYGLKNNVFFTGRLSEEDMCKYYLRSNVFVCPSSIENSPNSLAEAQLLGMPCIASYVGGIPDMMVGCEEWLYRFEEYEMLADKVCRVFSQDYSVDLKKMREMALLRHNRVGNAVVLRNIYKEIS